MSLSDAELQAILDRANACELCYMTALSEIVIRSDVPVLIAEIERLGAVIEEQKPVTDYDSPKGCADQIATIERRIAASVNLPGFTFAVSEVRWLLDRLAAVERELAKARDILRTEYGRTDV